MILFNISLTLHIDATDLRGVH